MQGFVWTGSTRTVVPLAKAAVPFGIPGVMFGESVFETLRARGGLVFQLPRHVDRLQGAVRGLGWGRPPTMEDLKSGLQAVLGAATEAGQLGPEGDLRIRMTVLRLDDSGGLEWVIQAVPYTPPSPQRYAAGVDAVIASVRLDGGAPMYQFKTGNRLIFRQAGEEARRAGVWEALLLNTDGMLADGTVSNIHIVQKGKVYSPSGACGALPGIAQAVVRECADQLHIPWTRGPLPSSLLVDAEEAFLTNALIGVLPLVRVGGAPVGSGTPGPTTRTLIDAYAARVVAQSIPVG